MPASSARRRKTSRSAERSKVKFCGGMLRNCEARRLPPLP
jgi:hypothetical protein